MRFSQIRLSQFKLFDKIQLDTKKLTLLTGANSSGKSSILNALAAITQTEQPHIYPFEFVPNGTNCSRFVNSILRAGCNTMMTRMALRIPWMLTPTPKWNLSVLRKQIVSIEENSDIDLRLATTRNINTFEKRLDSAKYDFVYMNPYHYTKYSEQHGYYAFAKAKKKRLKGIIIVKKERGVMMKRIAMMKKRNSYWRYLNLIIYIIMCYNLVRVTTRHNNNYKTGVST